MGLKDSEVSLYKLKEMKDNKELFTDEAWIPHSEQFLNGNEYA